MNWGSLLRSPVVRNLAWLSVDRLLKILNGIVVAVLVARLLGPEAFGSISFILAIVALFQALSTLGLDSVLVKRLVEEPDSAGSLVKTAFFLVALGSLATFLAAMGYLFTVPRLGPDEGALAVILSAQILFQVSVVGKLWFESRTQSRYNVIAENTAAVVASLLKVLVVLNHGSLPLLAACYLLESLTVASFILWFFFRHRPPNLNSPWNRALAVNLLKASWPLMLSGFAIMVYMRIDQVMLGQMLDASAVGTYSAALRLSELWYFIPMVMMVSVFPSLVRKKGRDGRDFDKAFLQLNRALFAIAFVVAGGMTVGSPLVISLLYGNQYEGAGSILAVHIWTGVFVFWGVAAGRWYLVHNLQKLSLVRSVAGAVLNVLLNLLLIPALGSVGAAVASLVAQVLTGFVMNAVRKQTRPLFILQLKSLAFWAGWSDYFGLAPPAGPVKELP